MFNFIEVMNEHWRISVRLGSKNTLNQNYVDLGSADDMHDAAQYQGLDKPPWKDKHFRRILDSYGQYDYRLND